MSSSFDRRVHNNFQTVDITVVAGDAPTFNTIPLNTGTSVPPLTTLQKEYPYPHLIRLTVPSVGAAHSVILPLASALKNASLSEIRIAIAITFLSGAGGSTVAIETTPDDDFFCFTSPIVFTAPEDDGGCVCIVVQSPPPNSAAPLDTQWTVISSYEVSGL